MVAQSTPPRFTSWAFLLAHVFTTMVGIVGLVGDPARSISSVLGVNTYGQLLYATIFLVFGVVGIVARIRKRTRVEAMAIFAIAGAFALWALMIVITGDTASFQPAATYFTIACIKMGWGGVLYWWAGSRLIAIPDPTQGG